MTYTKIGSCFERKYGKTSKELAKELGVTSPTLCKWEKQGFDIFYKAKEVIFLRRHKNITKLWRNMQQRCGNPNDKKYKYYGGKGIKIKMTKSDLAYLWHRDHAETMEHPSIDRIDGNGHYELVNCRFIEMAENRVKCQRSPVSKATKIRLLLHLTEEENRQINELKAEGIRKVDILREGLKAYNGKPHR